MSKEGLPHSAIRGIMAINEGIRPTLKKIRERNGLSQREVSRRSAATQQEISQIERSQVRDFFLDTLLQYAKGVDEELSIALVVNGRKILAAGYEILPTLIVIRKELAITQKEIATRTSLAQPQISYIEARKKEPKVTTIITYASAIDPRLTLALLDSRA